VTEMKLHITVRAQLHIHKMSDN